MMVGTTHYRCAKCTQVKEINTTNFYFDGRGRVTGYCIFCHRAYCRAYDKRLSGEARRHRRDQQRRWVYQQRHPQEGR